MKQTRQPSGFSCLSEYTRLYPIAFFLERWQLLQYFADRKHERIQGVGGGQGVRTSPEKPQKYRVS